MIFFWLQATPLMAAGRQCRACCLQCCQVWCSGMAGFQGKITGNWKRSSFGDQVLLISLIVNYAVITLAWVRKANLRYYIDECLNSVCIMALFSNGNGSISSIDFAS